MMRSAFTLAVAIVIGSSGCSSQQVKDPSEESADALRSDGACFSPTLGRSLEPGACVQSRSNAIFYQCVAGEWLRGVSGNAGPGGTCTSFDPLGGQLQDAGILDAEPLAPTTAACTSVAHIGDSLSAYTLGPLEARYRAHGATDVTLSAYGGRGIMQKLSADPETGRAAATRIGASGFSGCWVVALGTNDTANISAGANYTRGQAIDKMMQAIDPSARARVMWVNTFTTKTSGHWSNANMKKWNEALEGAKQRWANLVVFDWAAVAATGAAAYSDGIHHTTAGYAVRNEAIAEALARSFASP